VQFESERCAEEAKQSLQNTNFSGLRLNIEWSKNSGRFNENTRSKNDRSRNKRRSNSRDRSWRREERQMRRSPSYERRGAPHYS
jgi:RNA recognition motif-containing protein